MNAPTMENADKESKDNNEHILVITTKQVLENNINNYLYII